MKCASAAAEHYWDGVQARNDFDAELDAYLEEHGITYEQYRKQREDDQADYVISQREWA